MPDPAPPASTTTAPAPPSAVDKKAKAKAASKGGLPEGFVEVTIPSRYGSVYVKGPDGKEREFLGGQVAIAPVKQAKAWGVQPTTGSLEAKAGEAQVEVVSVPGEPAGGAGNA